MPVDTLADTLLELLRELTGTREITDATQLEQDLELESVDLVWLSERLTDRLGVPVDLPSFMTTLDIDAMIALTVGDLLAHLSTVAGGKGRA